MVPHRRVLCSLLQVFHQPQPVKVAAKEPSSLFALVNLQEKVVFEASDPRFEEVTLSEVVSSFLHLLPELTQVFIVSKVALPR